ncbi:MAG: hypothetical protein ACR2NG_08610 [Acidimicrobiia bacterium]
MGTRDDMRAYDCDDASQFEALTARVEDDGLLEANRLQSFAPDAPSEVRNRGFRPV